MTPDYQKAPEHLQDMPDGNFPQYPSSLYKRISPQDKKQILLFSRGFAD